MDLHEASIAWAEERRKRDRGEPWDEARVIVVMQMMFAELIAVSAPIDPSLPQSIVTEGGITDPAQASDEDWLRVAEDLYATLGRDTDGTSNGVP